jgi:hypothetical protein
MGITLVHGWVVETAEESQALQNFSYNQAIDFMLSYPDHPRSLQIRNFFDNSASQLTPTGLNAIRDYLQPEQLAVFFRNNHFSTIIKHGKDIYLLATDVAFVETDQVVWECLNEISGNNYYCNSAFQPIFHISQYSKSFLSFDPEAVEKEMMNSDPVDNKKDDLERKENNEVQTIISNKLQDSPEKISPVESDPIAVSKNNNKPIEEILDSQKSMTESNKSSNAKVSDQKNLPDDANSNPVSTKKKCCCNLKSCTIN